MRLEREDEQLFKNVLDGSIDRPAWKGEPIPIPQINSLQMLSETNRHEATKCVIALFRKSQHEATPSISSGFPIPLITQVIDDFVSIEGQRRIASCNGDVVEHVV